MKYALTHYDGDWSWVKDYTDDFLIYNRTDEDIPNSIKRENVGDADYDRLTYLIDHYHDLPELFLLAKSNLWKYISREEFDALEKQGFTPLLTQNHKTYEPVCRYQDGIYWEINNSWYLGAHPAKHFRNYGEFAEAFNLPNPDYLPFAPGGNYITTRERVHRHSREFYQRLAALLPYSARPGEAQMIERTYYTLWH